MKYTAFIVCLLVPVAQGQEADIGIVATHLNGQPRPIGDIAREWVTTAGAHDEVCCSGPVRESDIAAELNNQRSGRFGQYETTMQETMIGRVDPTTGEVAGAGSSPRVNDGKPIGTAAQRMARRIARLVGPLSILVTGDVDGAEVANFDGEFPPVGPPSGGDDDDWTGSNVGDYDWDGEAWGSDAGPWSSDGTTGPLGGPIGGTGDYGSSANFRATGRWSIIDWILGGDDPPPTGGGGDTGGVCYVCP